jgi:hypothetical protein
MNHARSALATAREGEQAAKAVFIESRRSKSVERPALALSFALSAWAAHRDHLRFAVGKAALARTRLGADAGFVAATDFTTAAGSTTGAGAGGAPARLGGSIGTSRAAMAGRGRGIGVRATGAWGGGTAAASGGGALAIRAPGTMRGGTGGTPSSNRVCGGKPSEGKPGGHHKAKGRWL